MLRSYPLGGARDVPGPQHKGPVSGPVRVPPVRPVSRAPGWSLVAYATLCLWVYALCLAVVRFMQREV